MSEHVFVVSEWQPKEGKDHELWRHLSNLMSLARQEAGCVRAHATRQMSHPGSPTQSKYTIVLLQEYSSIEAFDEHCSTEYVTRAFKELVENPSTSIIADWQCRLFREGEDA